MKKRGESHAQWITRIGKKLDARRERKQFNAERGGERANKQRPMMRKNTPDKTKVLKKQIPLIAYDLETTSIAKGTPRPIYLTACGPGFWYSGRTGTLREFSEILQTRFLDPALSGARFVAWNGNKFDVYFVAMALLISPDYILRPYLTSNKSLRGLRVIKRQFEDGLEITGRKGVKEISWEFLDGMSMTGILKPLKSKRDPVTRKVTDKGFLATFAPDYDYDLAIDFERESFNPDNAVHVKYAERDSEGLYVALMKVRDVVIENFSIDLCPTIGNMGIKIFQRFIPPFVEVWKPPVSALRAIRQQVMRGGYCWIQRRYRGPVWKYDLNQAYASAMREASLPAGHCVHSERGLNQYADIYIARVRGVNMTNKVPFYYRDIETGRSVFALQEIGETWLTSIEIEQLKREGWKLDIAESWFWTAKFKMKKYVDTLEALRIGGGRDPKDAQGEMCKYIGNNSYGKTVESLAGLDLVMAAEQPEGFSPYLASENPDLECIWFKFGTPVQREYHQPQIGAFITAQVRMVVRRAALLAPDAWLYADTDCVMFSQDMEHALDIDPGRYGAWKVEETGKEYLLLAKKCYVSIDGKTKHAKGMNINRLTVDDYIKWMEGTSPEQVQVQRQNFIKVLAGFDMFIEREKVAENFENTAKRAA